MQKQYTGTHVFTLLSSGRDTLIPSEILFALNQSDTHSLELPEAVTVVSIRKIDRVR